MARTDPPRPAAAGSTVAAAVPTPVLAAEAVIQTFARLNGRAWGIAVGLVCGLGLLVATWTLVFIGAAGGAPVGPHLSLLANFLPGYRVTIAGGFVGFVYAFVLGYAGGRLIGAVYNRFVPR